MGTFISIAIVVVIAIAFLFWQRQRTRHLHDRYGGEYERTVDVLGRRLAEVELVRREKRVEHLDIHPLTPDQRERFIAKWRAVQALFVEDPVRAASEGDRLVDEVMLARGYPVADFDQRVADLSVHHSRVVENYREARAIAQRHRRGEATTEDLRHAMVFYRVLFVDLLEEPSERRQEREVEREIVHNSDTVPVDERPDRRRRPGPEVRP